MAAILVVDDRRVNRDFLIALLGYAGHSVLQACDGRGALDIARASRPDLIISDILMPVMDGIQLANELRAEPDLARVPVMFYTASYRMRQARAFAHSVGVASVLAKPADPQVILDAVQSMLGLPAATMSSNAGAPGRGAAARAVEQSHSVCLDELANLQTHIRSLTNEALAESDGGDLRQAAIDLEESVRSADVSSTRLGAIVGLGLDLHEYTDVESLLEAFCYAAGDILDGRFAAVCVRRDGEVDSEVALWGFGAQQAEDIRGALNWTDGLFGNEPAQEGAIRRWEGGAAERAALGLPECHPAIGCIIIAPIVSSGVRGWFYVADKLGAVRFSDEDEQFAVTLAAQLGLAYGQLVLHDRARRDVSILEFAAAERRALDEKEALANERQFRDLAQHYHGVFQLIDVASAQMLYASPMYERIWQQPRQNLYARSQAWLDTVHPEDRARTLQAVTSASSLDSDDFTLEYRIARPDGEVRWIRSRGRRIRDAAGKVCRVAAIAEDVTAQKKQEVRLLHLGRIHAMLSGINTAMMRFHERRAFLTEVCRVAVDDGAFEFAWVAEVQEDTGCLQLVASHRLSQRTRIELAGYNAEGGGQRGSAMRALHSKKAIVVDDIRKARDLENDPVAKLALERGCGSLVNLPLSPKGEPGYVMVLYAVETRFFDAEELALLGELAGEVSFALRYLANEQKLAYLANYDVVTALPNTALLREQLAQLLRNRGHAGVAMFLLDIDHFTQLNSSFGRLIADRILADFATRLRAAVPEAHCVARIGSDTFAIAVSVPQDETAVGLILHEKIFAALSKPFEVAGKEILISARAGVATAPRDGAEAETLFTNAEAALRQSKLSGARCVLYSHELNARVAEDLALEQRLRAAWERREFVVHYQPQVSAKDGRIVGLEALLRWNSPEAGLVPPSGFIGALEDSELILDVGQWTLEKALADCKTWRQQGLAVPRLAVNVSAVQLRHADFSETVLEVIANSGASGVAVELEITESVVMANIQSYLERFEKLRDHGVTIAIDDFGTGSSSLRYLAQLPVETLKIDRSFVAGMTNDSDGLTMVSTIIGLAHSFDLRVVAEGVESEDQARLLKLMKCDVLQGYLFGKPMPEGEFGAGLVADAS